MPNKLILQILTLKIINTFKSFYNLRRFIYCSNFNNTTQLGTKFASIKFLFNDKINISLGSKVEN
jgi:hypothetical protein